MHNGFNKAFIPNVGLPDSITTVQIKLVNEAGIQASNAAFADELPEKMRLATNPNFTYTDCGTPITNTSTIGTGATASGKVEISGATISPQVNGVNGVCTITFDVIAPETGQYINNIPVGDLTATLNGVQQSNMRAATATLTSGEGNIDVKHQMIFWDGVTHQVLRLNAAVNAGDDFWLETVLTNPNSYTLTNVTFENAYPSNFVTAGDTANIQTDCSSGTTGFIPASTGPFIETVSLSGASLAPNQSCYVRIKLDPKFLNRYSRGNFTDAIEAGVVTADGVVKNTVPQSTAAGINKGGEIRKSFCPDPTQTDGSNCSTALELNSNSYTDASIRMRIELWTRNTAGIDGAYPLIIEDYLPAGMTLANPLPTAIGDHCANVDVSGNAVGATTLKIDTRNMTSPLPKNNLSDIAGLACTILVSVDVDRTVSGDYINDMTKTPSMTLGTRGLNDLPVSDVMTTVANVHPAQLRFSTGSFGLSKRFVRLDQAFTGVTARDVANLRPGDDVAMEFILSNLGGAPITNVTINDDLSQMGFDNDIIVYRSDDWRLELISGSVCSVATGGTAFNAYNYPDTNLTFTGITVPAQSSCRVLVPLIIRPDLPLNNAFQTKTNTIGGASSNSVTYQQNGNTHTLAESTGDDLILFQRADIRKTFNPTAIGVGGVSVMTIAVRSGSVRSNLNGTEPDQRRGFKAVELIDPFPAGMRIADVANPVVQNTCQGTLTAVPNSTELRLTNGVVGADVNYRCTIQIQVTATELGPNNRLTNTIASIAAQEADGPLAGTPINMEKVSGNLTATLNTSSAFPAINKQFNPKELSANAVSRASVQIINDDGSAVDLDNVGLTDNLLADASSPLRIVGDGNPSFSDNLDGTGNSQCQDASFAVSADKTTIVLSGASVAKGSTCYLNFDVTSANSGTYINRIEARALSNNQNLYNESPAQIDVTFTKSKATIGVKKSAATPTFNAVTGEYTVAFEVGVKNFGAVDLNTVSVADTLTGEFGALGADYRIVTVPTIKNITSGSSLTANTAFDGSNDTALVTENSTNLLKVDGEAIIAFSIAFIPQPTKTAYANSVTTKGTDIINAANVVEDTSNDGNYVSITPNDDDPTDDNTPTEVNIAPKTIIGLAKAASPAMPEMVGGAPTGNFISTMSIVAKNSGEQDLTGVSVVDSLITNGDFGFGTYVNGTPSNAGEYSVANLAVTNNTVGAVLVASTAPAFDGNTNTVLATGDLARATSATMTFDVVWRPVAGDTDYQNQATTTATSTITNTAVTDISTNGDNPDTDNNGDPTDNSDPTPVNVMTTPVIGIAKSATTSLSTVPNVANAYAVTMTLTVRNYGNETLNNVKISDSLTDPATGFGSYVTDIASLTGEGQYTVTTALPTSSPLTLNPNYNGGTDSVLVSGGQLAVGEMTTVTLTISFIPNLTAGRYNFENSALADATGTVSGNAAPQDVSENGSNPDPDGNNNPSDNGEDTPTPVVVIAKPQIGIAKEATTQANNDGTYTTTITLKVENVGNEALKSVSVSDNLSTEFGAFVATLSDKGQYRVHDITATGLTANSSFTGDGANQVVASGELAIRGSATVSFKVTFNPAKTNYVNQAIANATGTQSNNPTEDLSDNGSEVDADNDGNPNEAGENDQTPISITPNPVVGIGETAGTVTNNGDGTFTVPLTINIENIGNENVDTVTVSNALTTTFGDLDANLASAGSYKVDAVSAPTGTGASDLTQNLAFNGDSDDQIITGGSLDVGEKATMVVTVTFRPQSGVNTFTNQSTINAVGVASTTTTMDLSNDGGVIDSDNNGVASETVGSGENGDNKPTVIRINRLPIAVDDRYTTPHKAPLTLNPLNGDSDPEGGALSIVSINGVDLTPGTVQTIALPNGSVSVTWRAGVSTLVFNGSNDYVGEVSFPYVIQDEQGNQATANELITLTNSAPVAIDDTYTTNFDTAATLNPLYHDVADSDADDDVLSITAINSQPLVPGDDVVIAVPNGSVNVTWVGSIPMIVFMPTSGFSGQTSFSYTVNDGHDTASATEFITISPAPNTRPVAVNDTYNTTINTPVTLNPLTGDSDNDGDTLTVSAINGTSLVAGTVATIAVDNGSVSVTWNGNTPVIVFTPSNNFTGTVSFPYSISDDKGGMTIATETIVILAAPTQIPAVSTLTLLVLMVVLLAIVTKRRRLMITA